MPWRKNAAENGVPKLGHYEIRRRLPLYTTHARLILDPKI
jgi:hypothetical protein